MASKFVHGVRMFKKSLFRKLFSEWNQVFPMHLFPKNVHAFSKNNVQEYKALNPKYMDGFIFLATGANATN